MTLYTLMHDYILRIKINTNNNEKKFKKKKVFKKIEKLINSNDPSSLLLLLVYYSLLKFYAPTFTYLTLKVTRLRISQCTQANVFYVNDQNERIIVCTIEYQYS